jgi:septum site-determining protein MinD
MVKTISIHSSRGGTGKSLISSNLSVILAAKGYNVALFDFDFRAPSLLTIFQARRLSKNAVNDFLDGKTKLSDIIVDVTSKFDLEGKLLLGFANDEMEAMRDIALKDRKWQMQALRRINALKEELQKSYDVDIILFDTSPGVQYSSVNAVVSSDTCIIVSSMDILDLEGVQRMIKDLYEPFEKETYILVNKAIPYMLMQEDRKNDFVNEIKNRFTQPIIAIIPCYCDILLAQRVSLFTLEKPDHPFTWALTEVSKRIEK